MEKKNLRIVFMGTPDFAVASLQAILDNGYTVAGVITAPDREAGRGKKVRFSAVKEYALKQNLKILQPVKLKDGDFLSELASLKADLQVVVAFRMLPEAVWSMPRLGTFNLHASLLPQYRGAAPINHALINGEKVTGVTTFFLDKEIDTGRIIDRVEVPIRKDDDFGTLHDRLMQAGAKLVADTIEKIRTGNVKPVDQAKLVAPGEVLHPAPKIFKEFCRINWHQKGERVYNFIRGLSPYPGAYTYFNIEDNGQLMVKIFKTAFEEAAHNNEPGSVLREGDRLKTAVDDGYIYIKELQAPGKKRMFAGDFLRGFHQNILSAG
jgi:methionyl-tRNA formyltransferase